ncbi:MAG: hypothetical protein A2161_08645 [Candidatus Schekmanbacteria bacterium RBG_13_48_7]|uniref:Right handed beta helix domain-containing protein n=1 Tax=Candidatus Schekmanbacteria bacterium RBG_13_48_7 TaxID=1817878 RepID=A0A1F7RVW3_9BACT|nr:MAG: hypothetical protein A2161_08645 [Candidatus Schekmanbacteria bacterium RBG_13_48_7]
MRMGFICIMITGVLFFVMTSVCYALIVVPDDISTIQAALNTALSGETVYVKPGVYKEFLTMYISKEYHLVGEDRDTTIIDGNLTGIPLQINTNKNVTVESLTLQNSSADGILATLPSQFEICNCLVTNNNDNGISINHLNYNIQYCEITHNKSKGIYSLEWSSGEIQDSYIGYNVCAIALDNFNWADIHNNIIEYNSPGSCSVLYTLNSFDINVYNNIIRYNNSDYAGIIYVSGSGATFTNNFFYRNSSKGSLGNIVGMTYVINNTIIENTCTLGGGGIVVYCGEIINNIIAFNSNYGIFFDSSAHEVQNNNIFGNIPAEIHDLTKDYDDIDEFNREHGAIGNISCDTMFISSGDYHITETSCVVDKGTSYLAPATDLEGDSRPFGAGYDIGADEFIKTFVPVDEPTIIAVLFIFLGYIVQRLLLTNEGRYENDKRGSNNC